MEAFPLKQNDIRKMMLAVFFGTYHDRVEESLGWQCSRPKRPPKSAQVGGFSSITWGMSFKMAVLMILTASTGHSLSHRQLGGDASRLLHQSPFTIHIQTAAAIGTLIEQGLMSWKPREGIARLAPSDSVVHH